MCAYILRPLVLIAFRGALEEEWHHRCVAQGEWFGCGHCTFPGSEKHVSEMVWWNWLDAGGGLRNQRTVGCERLTEDRDFERSES